LARRLVLSNGLLLRSDESEGLVESAIELSVVVEDGAAGWSSNGTEQQWHGAAIGLSQIVLRATSEAHFYSETVR
jgi:hypothetical protein